MTEDEWEKLNSNFDTTSLLTAVDAIDELRGSFADRDGFEPPEIRNDLLKLHVLAMDVVNMGLDGSVTDMAILALALQDQTDDMLELLEQVNQTVSQLVSLLPENAFDLDE